MGIDDPPVGRVTSSVTVALSPLSVGDTVWRLTPPSVQYSKQVGYSAALLVSVSWPLHACIFGSIHLYWLVGAIIIPQVHSHGHFQVRIHAWWFHHISMHGSCLVYRKSCTKMHNFHETPCITYTLLVLYGPSRGIWTVFSWLYYSKLEDYLHGQTTRVLPSIITKTLWRIARASYIYPSM